MECHGAATTSAQTCQLRTSQVARSNCLTSHCLMSDESHPDLICLSIVYVQTVIYHHSRSAWRRVKSQGSCGERVPPSLLPIRQLRLYICCLILTVLLLQHNL